MGDMVRILRAQLVLCQELLKLGQKYRKYLLEKNTLESRRIINRQEEYIGKITALEKQKQILLQQAGVSTVQFFLAEQELSPEGELLQHLAESLQQTMLELKAKNQQNTALLQKYMDFIDFSVNVIAQTTTDSIYAKRGETPPSAVISQKKMFDQTI